MVNGERVVIAASGALQHATEAPADENQVQGPTNRPLHGTVGQRSAAAPWRREGVCARRHRGCGPHAPPSMRRAQL